MKTYIKSLVNKKNSRLFLKKYEKILIMIFLKINSVFFIIKILKKIIYKNFKIKKSWICKIYTK